MKSFQLNSPWFWVFVCALMIAIGAAGLPKVVKDTTTDALIPPADPANLYRQEINDVFGIKDPIVIGLVARNGESVFSPRGLEKLREVHRAIEQTSNVRRDRIKSLVSEIAISGTGTEVLVKNFLPDGPITEEQAQQARKLVRDTPLVQKVLVSDDEQEALIVAELIDHKIADLTYEALEQKIVPMADDQFQIVVAGQGAVSGYFNKYLSTDSKRMLPMALVVMLLVLLVTFRSIKSAIGPLLVVLGTVAITIGLKGWFGVSYYVITTSLPALLVAVAVADSIHLLSVYFDDRLAANGNSHKQSMTRALNEQAVPITLTSITSSVGFLALALFSSMPPMYYFGLFAAIGVLVAWVMTLLLLPAVTILLKLEPSKAFASMKSRNKDGVSKAMVGLIGASARAPMVTVIAFAAIAAFSAYFTTTVQFDRRQVENFRTDAPIRQADELLNEHFAGTSYLEVMVTSSEEEGMFSRENLDKVSALQQFMAGLQGVQKTQSILDYLHTLDKAFNPDVQSSAVHRLPADDDGVAQYVLFLESSGDPTALRDRIDSRYKSVLVRAYLNDSSYRHSSPIVNAVRAYVNDNFDESATGLTAKVGGRLNVDYSWMYTLENEHVKGVMFSISAILVFACLLFRSFFHACLAVIPVVFSILMIYGTMGFLGIKLEPATSMFACISLGLGVDFGIHFVHKLRALKATQSGFEPKSLSHEISGTARACYFNAAALTFGFMVLLFGQLPTVNRFGGLIALAATTSFVAAMLILPAMYRLMSRSAR